MHTFTSRSAALVVSAFLIACGGERRSETATPLGGRGLHGDTLTIIMIGKSVSNPVFTAAENGAQAAARDLSQKHNIHIAVRLLTPDNENPTVQAERVKQAVDDGADAVLISVSDTAVVTPAIDSAVAHGVEVMTFDSDAPGSRRFAFYGIDDYDLGQRTMQELASIMNNSGKVAILAGSATAPNLQARERGAREEAAKHSGMQVVGTFHHAETPEAATAEFTKESKAHPDITGWAMVGGWPLFGNGLLTVVNPARVKIVAVDALPSELQYVEKGVVPVLIAQPVYQWGYVGVSTIVDKVHFKAMVPQHIPMPLERVTKETLKQWAQQFKDWGFKDVPAAYLQ